MVGDGLLKMTRESYYMNLILKSGIDYIKLQMTVNELVFTLPVQTHVKNLTL